MCAEKIIIAHPSTDLKQPEKIGGAVRRSLDLLSFFSSNGISVLFLGVYKTSKYNIIGKDFSFLSISKKTRPYKFVPFSYIINLCIMLIKHPVPHNSVIITFRLDVMIPFIIFCHNTPKIIISDEPLGETRLRVNKHVFKAIEIMHKAVSIYSYKKVDKIITDVSTSKKYMAKYSFLKEKIVSIQTTTVDLNFFYPMDKVQMRKKYGFDVSEDIILYVGRLAKIKRLDFLLRVFKKLKDYNQNAKLLIIGDGDEAAFLKSYAKRLDLSDVIFLGAVSHKKIPEIMNCADVLILCSLSEGSPIVVREALASGVPVISTDVGDISSLIKNGYVGGIVDFDEESFCMAITQILSIDKNLVQQECIKIAETCTANQHMLKLITICNEL